METERAVTAQQVEAQIQSALSKQQQQQQQQQTQIVQLVREQIQLHNEQRQTETVERERKLQKLQQQLDRYQSSTNKRFGKLRQTANADNLSDSGSDSDQLLQQSQLQTQYAELQLQHSQLQSLQQTLQQQHEESVQKQLQLLSDQYQTETAEREKEIQKQLNQLRSSTAKQFKNLRHKALASKWSDSDSDSEQQSQLSQLQIQCDQLRSEHTQLTAEHGHLQFQFGVNLNSRLKPQLIQLTAEHKALQAQYTESEAECKQHNASERATTEQLRHRVSELEEQLTALSDSDHSIPEPLSLDTSLSVQPKRGRRKGIQYYQQDRQRRLTQQQELQQQRQENKWHRVVQYPVWSQHTLSTEQHTSLAQYRALEVQLRDSVTETPGYSGTVGERMVQWFRARLNRFLESVKGHALLSVKSDIERELRDSQHSNSATRT